MVLLCLRRATPPFTEELIREKVQLVKALLGSDEDEIDWHLLVLDLKHRLRVD